MTTGRRALSLALPGALVAGALGAQASALVLDGGTAEALLHAGWVLAGLAVLAASLAARVALEPGRPRNAWALWAAASVLFAAGAVARPFLAGAGLDGSPDLADGLWWGCGLLSLAGIAARTPAGALAFRLALLDALPAVALAVVGAQLLDPGAGAGTVATAAVYAGLFVLLAFAALQFLLLSGLRAGAGRRIPRWGRAIFAASFLLLAGAALTWPRLAGGEGDPVGHWSTALWTAGLVVLAGWGTWRARFPQSAGRYAPPEREAGWRAVPPTAALLGLALLETLGPGDAGRLGDALLYAGIVALAARFVFVRREAGRSQAALREGERRYRTLVEQLPFATYLDALDEQSSNLYTSPQLELLLGYSAEEWRASPDVLARLLHPDDRERVLAEVRRTNATGETFEAEYRLVARDGTVRWFRDEAVVVRDEEGVPQYSQGYLMDITERKEVEESLRETTETLSALVAASPAAIVGFDEEGRVILWNPAAERTFGWSAGEVSGRFNPLVADADRESFLEYVRLALLGRSWRDIEVVRVRKDGSPIELSVSSAPLVGGDGKAAGMVSVLLDITERKRAEEELRESEERYRTLVSNLPGLVYRSAATTLGAVEFLTDDVEAMTGYPASDFVGEGGRPLSDLIHPDDRASVHETIAGRIAAGAPFAVEYRALHRDGSIRWLHENGQPVLGSDGAVLWLDGVILDVTERKEAEAQLARERELMDAYMELTPDFLYFKDAEGRYLRVSDALADRLGLDGPEATVGRTAFDFISPERAAEAEVEEREIMRSGRPLLDREVLQVFPGGHERWLVTSKLPLRDARGEVVGTFGVSRDVTARKRAEEERERALAALEAQNDRLLELDRMKDEFVASVSHELRTPLTSIIGYLELVLEGDAGTVTDEQRAFLSVVERNAERLLRLVGDLLLIAQIEAGTLALEREQVDLDAVARDCLAAAKPGAAAKDIVLSLRAGERPVVLGDRVRLAQLLDNLVANAIKFTPAGGRVSVGVGRENGATVVDVADTGIGIPPGELASVFDRFFRASGTVRNAIQGTGLGLAITKAIAEAHGGRITVESEQDTGTTFRVELPAVEPEQPPGSGRKP